jgi:hypothetical protein
MAKKSDKAPIMAEFNDAVALFRKYPGKTTKVAAEMGKDQTTVWRWWTQGLPRYKLRPIREIVEQELAEAQGIVEQRLMEARQDAREKRIESLQRTVAIVMGMQQGYAAVIAAFTQFRDKEGKVQQGLMATIQKLVVSIRDDLENPARQMTLNDKLRYAERAVALMRNLSSGIGDLVALEQQILGRDSLVPATPQQKEGGMADSVLLPDSEEEAQAQINSLISMLETHTSIEKEIAELKASKDPNRGMN